jgi:hypothetical protein
MSTSSIVIEPAAQRRWVTAERLVSPLTRQPGV